MQIYFDNSATTKIDPRVFDAMLPYLQDKFGNAGSVHSFGQSALSAVDEARDRVADFLGCEAQEIIFTSGATESNNLAIRGLVEKLGKQGQKVHIITSKIEHPAVLEVFKYLEKNNQVETDYIDVDENGVIKIDQLEKKIKANTILVSIMYANNEVGSVQPIEEIGEIIRAKRDKQDRENKKSLPLYFHVDAVQAMNYLDCNVDKLCVDLLSLSGHKIYGPKGIGALYVRRGVKIDPIIFGGHQEYNLRPGTHNVAGIVGLGAAMGLINQKKQIEKVKQVKQKIVEGLDKIKDIRFNGNPENQLPNIINVSFKNAEGESILMMLDMAGIAVSTGSACSSGSLEPSHVLSAMGIKPEWSHGSIRVSLGRFNSLGDVAPFIKEITRTVEKLRQMAPK